MTHKRNVTLKILLFLAFIDVLETFAQFCFKKTALGAAAFEISTPADAVNFMGMVISSPFLWVGLVSVFMIFTMWTTVLSKIDLSVAVPVCSFSYITVPIVSMTFFHEQISALRWSGIFVILIGVIIVSLSSKHKELLE